MNKIILNIVYVAIMALLLSCQNEAEFNIEHLDAPLKAKFSADKGRVFINEDVTFANASVGALKYEWAFEGGEPATSTEENPVVKYAAEGTYKVTLIVKNGAKQNISANENYITVFSEECWKDMVMPTINFKNTASEKTLYQQLVPYPEKLIHQACFDVARWLFVCPEEMDILQNIDYTVEDNDGISAKGGQAPNINIFFSATYLEKKKAEGLSDVELLDEIKGVLYHEVTHGYQFSPLGAGEYKAGDDFYGFIEGMADYVRYVSGYLTTADRSEGGHWNDGYKTSGFFIDWLHSKDPNFLNKLNHTAKTINPWSWDKAANEITGKTVRVLWDEYQDDIKTGKIKEIDEKLIKLRNGENVQFVAEVEGTVVDITNEACVVTYDTAIDSPDSESVYRLIDNDNNSKFLAFSSTIWAQFESKNSSVVTKYTLVSGNDAPERDPKNWSLKASNDGTTWVEIDARTGESFADRKTLNEYTFENTTAYKMYKFEFENSSGDIFQLSEIEIFGLVTEVSPLIDITKKNAIFTAGHEDATGGWGLPEFCYDGNCGTPCFAITNETWLQFENTEMYNVTEFAITNSGDFNGQRYDVSNFTISGSNDGTTWTEIKAEANLTFDFVKERKVFKFENKDFYKFHKVDISNVKIADGYLMVGDIELYGAAE